jgi:1,4-alpha-glucan branching enzyme
MTPPSSSPVADMTAKRPSFFSKVFRWQQETPGPLPVKVEIVGSFNGWKKTPLRYDRPSGVWQLTQENIPGHCTHNYMLLVNGRPTQDKTSDGLAVPRTAEEKQYQLVTPRGPRVFMLFSQTK